MEDEYNYIDARAYLNVRGAQEDAKDVKAIYDAYIEVGFTPEQAFDLLKSLFSKSIISVH